MFADELEELEVIESQRYQAEEAEVLVQGEALCLYCGYPLTSLDCTCDLLDLDED